MAKPEESNVDVLIVGAGPAGLMATIWMSRLGIKTRTVDKRGTKVFNGQADGLQPRTMEIFDSFGFANRVVDAAQPFHDMVSWGPDESGKIERKERFIETFAGFSRFTEYVLNQGYIESYFLESISAHSDIAVERGVLPSELTIDESKANDPDAYPVTVTLQHLSEEDAQPHQCKSHVKHGQVKDGLYRSNLSGDDTSHLIDKAVASSPSEIVHAKYVIGCDGAHSWTRQKLGFEMKGDSTDYVWGVIDIIPITNYPDIRRPGTIQSEKGSMLIIPREKKLVRLYTQLHEVKPDESGNFDRSKITPEAILKTSQKILEPYTLDYAYCDWWTAYQVGQRVGTGFCDPTHRVFLAGDAVHTHSPKAGQGMNVSMQDTYNLGWKIGGVLKGWLNRDVLDTYQPERRKLAQDLIDFDHKLSRTFSGSPSQDDLVKMYQENMVFMSGFGVHYLPSSLVASASSSASEDSKPDPPLRDAAGTPLRQTPAKAKQQYAKHTPLGEVLKCATVIAHCDTRPWDLNSCLRSDGRWRLIVFAGDVSEPAHMQRLNDIGASLVRPGGLLERYTVLRPRPGLPGSSDSNKRIRKQSLVDVLTVHAGDINKVETTAFHAAFFPFDDEEGYDYDKVFADTPLEAKGGGAAYGFYGVDRAVGALVVTRPDQYVAFVTGLDGLGDVEEFFDGVLIRQDGLSGGSGESGSNGKSGENGSNGKSGEIGSNGKSSNGVR